VFVEQQVFVVEFDFADLGGGECLVGQPVVGSGGGADQGRFDL
jgi:hypothetical protein